MRSITRRNVVQETMPRRCMVEETIPMRSVIEDSMPMRSIGKRVSMHLSILEKPPKRRGVSEEEIA